MGQVLRSRAYSILETRPDHSLASRICSYGLLILILVNVAAVTAESVEPLYASYRAWFYGLEVFSVAVFTLEYGLRVWCSPESQCGRSGSDLRKRLRYVITPMALIDLLAILPFYLAFLVPLDLRFMRVLRLVRLVKLSRYSRSLELLLQVLREEARAIGAALFVLFLMLMLAASLAHLAEHRVQPDVFGSIPQAMWWAIVTMTTVGYGDVTPVTTLGKFLAAGVGILGLGMVALPAGLLASGFTQKLHQRVTTYETLVERALDDGVVTPDEERELAHARDELGLNDEQVAMVRLIEQLRAQDRHRRCPHCGHMPADPSPEKILEPDF